MKRMNQWPLILGLALAGLTPAADGGAPEYYTGTVVNDQGQPAAGARGALPAPQAGISPSNEPAALPAAGNPSPTANRAATEAVPDDDALRSYLGQSELVVVGEMMFANMRSASLDQFKVADTIKGEPQPYVLIRDDPNSRGQHVDYPDGEIVVFLWKRAVSGSTNLEAFWRPRDAQFGAMPATPALVASLKRLAAAQTPNSGENQLGALMRKYLPNYSLRELKYTIGDQTCATAVLTGLGTELDRREMKWVVGHSARAPKDLDFITVLHCPKLLGALRERSNVQTARDAEDYVKLVFGLCAGPRAVEYWNLKATPLGDSWLVTPTYVGPPGEHRAVGPMELVYMNRAAGNVADICEWRPNFKPGQTAKVMRPTGMDPDGLDPAPAELDDATLDYYLSRCEMVVVGKVMNDVHGGFVSGMRLHANIEFQVAEAIKGTAAPGSTIEVQVSDFLKKDDQLILFLNYQGGAARKGTDLAPVWVRIWDTDDSDFGALRASPALVAALKGVAVAHGAALETPNLYWGAEVDGISVQLDTFLGRRTAEWRSAQDNALGITVVDRGANGFDFARDQQGGELEVDGTWYSWPNATNMFVMPSGAGDILLSEIRVTVGQQWRVKTQGLGQPEGMGAPLNLVPGTHKIRFALFVRRKTTAAGPGLAPEIRAVSNPVEIEVRDDSARNGRPARTAAATIPPATPVRATGGEYEVDGEIVQTSFDQGGGVGSVQRGKFTVFVKDCSWLIQTIDHDENGEPLVQRETACTNGAEIYEVVTGVRNKNADGNPRLGSSFSVGSIISNDVPVGQSGGYFVSHLWLMFASGCYFANLSTNWLTSVYEVSASAPGEFRRQREAKWKLINGPGSLPSSVVYSQKDNRMEMFMQEGLKDNRLQTIIQEGLARANAVSLQRETIDATYTATGVTNAGKTQMPGGFVFEQRVNNNGFAPGPILPGQSVPAYHILKRAVATVTAVRPICSRSILLPAAEGRTIVYDRRWANPEAPQSLTSYSFENGVQWLPVEKAKQLFMNRRTPASAPKPAP